MDLIYVNSDYTRSASQAKCSRSKEEVENSFRLQRERKVTLPKWSKVLLIVQSVSLVCALGGLCVLGILHHTCCDVLGSDQDHNATDYKGKFDALRDQYEETLQKLNRLNETSGCPVCAVHWIHAGGKCYFFSTAEMNWTQSRDHCVTLGGHLVVINSRAEQDFLVSKVKVTHWIGLNDLETEGRWVWVNNQPLNDSIEFWIKRENGVREPDNWMKGFPPGEDCASLGHSHGETDFWTDAFCFQEKRFVCEAPASV